jgi:hypothetical protein
VPITGRSAQFPSDAKFGFIVDFRERLAVMPLTRR